jgi:sugar O-acyltransferase (sialic acid O-acetyltransferase NeuD family)
VDPFLIFGTGGFARETRDIAFALDLQPVIVAADEAARAEWIGDEEIILEHEVERYQGVRAAIGIGENSVRQKIAIRYADSLRFTSLIHPSASFGKGQRAAVEAAKGVVICAGVRMTNSIEMGDYVILNLNSTVGHDVILGDFVNVAPGANISGHVVIGDGVWVGTNVAINQGAREAKLRIGRNAVIGSGSVVVRDCEADGVYVGIPAKKR